MKIYGLNKFYDLTPFELLSINKNLEYCPPSKNNPISRYLPKIEKIVSAKNIKYPHIKPGFYEQSKIFIRTIQGKIKQTYPNIEDALRAQMLLQYLYKDFTK